MSKKTAPYGTWSSPITAEAITQGSISIDDVFVDPVTSKIYHSERRPSEQGRIVIVDTKDGHDLFGPGFNARSGVEEYGGAAVIAHGGIVFFSNIMDGRVYSIDTRKDHSVPEAVTPVNKAHRFANFAVHPTQNHLIVSVLEDHTEDTPQTVCTMLCVIDVSNKSVTKIVSGADFYASPAFSPDGTKIAWQQWNHPDMPWEGSEIYVADVRADEHTFALENTTHVAGEKVNISVGYPSWANNSTLIFTSDEGSGFQNPWTYSTASKSARLALAHPVKQDFAQPAWALGLSPYAFLDAVGSRAVFLAYRCGRTSLYVVDLQTPSEPYELSYCPFSVIQRMRTVPSGSFVFSAGRPEASGGVVHCVLTTSAESSITAEYTVLKSTASAAPAFPPGIVSLPSPMTLTRDGEPLYVVYYPPTNPEYSGSSVSGEQPPCIVDIHGGPTSMASQALSWEKQYFTSRGYAWLDVNYGGSSGYGRAYIARLAGNWGVSDVQDSIDAATILASPPYSLIDVSRVAIRGGSSGGYTVLCALVASPFFAAGTSLYGISNLELLTEDTHKFELRYMEKLIGGTIKEIPKVYRERSPVFHAENIVSPLLVLQGSEDRVVPPAQSEEIVKKIKEKPNGEDKVEYHVFEGEGHGWRRAENMKAALEYELAWYEKKLLHPST
ncbi:Alpha/Beta hydrolase protein [Hygrophoropsis aurantiaca]|uniref:Alpha/Beta hydrolase protein n=1 Tax=Hygrophoropsis aurantiaca TaxID=72124 RepID=A0ACB8ACE9_9AGAM|nr:Alpha/Beta hydrolase protein [Hygrophoropsis aurantiaca]